MGGDQFSLVLFRFPDSGLFVDKRFSDLRPLAAVERLAALTPEGRKSGPPCVRASAQDVG